MIELLYSIEVSIDIKEVWRYVGQNNDSWVTVIRCLCSI